MDEPRIRGLPFSAAEEVTLSLSLTLTLTLSLTLPLALIPTLTLTLTPTLTLTLTPDQESCGETSCLLHKPRATTVTCISDEGCEALCVSREDFLSLVRGSWDVRQNLIDISERHRREKQRRISFRRTQEEADDNDYDIGAEYSEYA